MNSEIDSIAIYDWMRDYGLWLLVLNAYALFYD